MRTRTCRSRSWCDELEPERDLSHTPLFQVMFVLQNAPGGPIELAGLRLDPIEVVEVSAKFDVSLYLDGVSRRA